MTTSLTLDEGKQKRIEKPKRRIPEEKESFAIGNYHFEILKRRGHDLVWVKVKKTKDL